MASSQKSLKFHNKNGRVIRIKTRKEIIKKMKSVFVGGKKVSKLPEEEVAGDEDEKEAETPAEETTEEAK